MERQQRWQDWVNLVLGVWLFLSPFFGIGESQAATTNSYVFGFIVAAASAWALSRPRIWEEWVNLAVGVWLIIAPLVLGFSNETGAMWNHIIVGLVVAGDALWVMLQRPIHRPA